MPLYLDLDYNFEANKALPKEDKGNAAM